MGTIKTTTCLGIVIVILSSIILIASCTSETETETLTTTQTQTQDTKTTTQTDPVSGESLFQHGQNQALMIPVGFQERLEWVMDQRQVVSQ